MSLKIRLTDQAESGHTYQVCGATQWLFKVHRFHPIKALVLKHEICKEQSDTLGLYVLAVGVVLFAIGRVLARAAGGRSPSAEVP